MFGDIMLQVTRSAKLLSEGGFSCCACLQQTYFGCVLLVSFISHCRLFISEQKLYSFVTTHPEFVTEGSKARSG
jgi:hypothetical protein